MKITVEQLLADGWVKTDDPAMPIEKKLENINPLNQSEDTDIRLVLHRMYNSNQFAILLPDGGLLNFSANTMAQLHAFEAAISFYDAPF